MGNVDFERAARYAPECVSGVMLRLPSWLLSTTQEIRLRAGAPVVLSTPGQEWMITRGGRETRALSADLLTVSSETLEECFHRVCEYSVHSHQHELCRGFVTTKDGLRVGIAGTAVTDHGKITSVRRISSLCIRIARRHDGCAEMLSGSVISENRIHGTLICGAPSSGKTSLLRDLAHRLASGAEGKMFRVAVVDERGELSMCGRLEGCDVLKGYPKPEGIQQAVRCFAPDVVMFDELGTSGEVTAVLDGLNAGVATIATAHASDSASLLRRPQILQAVRSGAFERLAFIKGRDDPGAIGRIIETGDFFVENDRSGSGCSIRCGSRNVYGVGAEQESRDVGGCRTAG